MRMRRYILPMRTGAVSKLKQVFEDFGVPDGLLYLIQRVLARLPFKPSVMKYHLVAQAVPPATPNPRPHSLDIKEITAADYQYDWFPRPRHFVEARFNQGAVCFVAFAKKQAIACLWLKQDGYWEDTVRAHFTTLPADQTVWDFDVYVDPKFRLGRTFLHIWEYAFKWMRDRNIQWTMSRIDAFNLSSIRSHQRMGAQFLSHVVFWQFGKFQISLANTKPRLAVNLRQTPEFSLTAPENAESAT